MHSTITILISNEKEINCPKIKIWIRNISLSVLLRTTEW